MNRNRAVVLLAFCIFPSIFTLTIGSPCASIEKVTQIQVLVRNEDLSRELCVNCGATVEKQPRKLCVNQTHPTGLVAWKFPTSAWDVVYCSAIWGSSRLNDFSVFGDGVPRQNNSWVIDQNGKRRVMENGIQVNDFIGIWEVWQETSEWWWETTTTPWPDTTTSWPETTTSWPETSTTPRPETTSPLPETTTSWPETSTTPRPETTSPLPETTTSWPETSTTPRPETTSPWPETTTSWPETSTTPKPETTTPWPEASTTSWPETTTTPWPETSTENWETTTKDPSAFQCPEESGNFADEEDCTYYYACDNWEVVGHIQCPDGLFFNPAINNCDYPWNVDCDITKGHSAIRQKQII